MSLERRLVEALHHADHYQPSVDLYARVSRSIEEDKAHRHRMRIGVAAGVSGLVIGAVFLGAVAGRDQFGVLVFPKWSIQVLLLVFLITGLVALGPAIRRLGQPFLAEIFHISPATGDRFSRLLDLAYYLFFSGRILSAIDVTEAASLVRFGSESVRAAIFATANFLALLGFAHAANLLLLPVVGLVFSSLTRLARRRIAGDNAPPVAARARLADRLASGFVMIVLLLALGGALVLIVVLLLWVGN